MIDAFARRATDTLGSTRGFLFALTIIAAWAISGPWLHYSEVWQLTINTGTTIVTFLMGFLILRTQNLDARAQAVKLDELLRAVEGARSGLAGLEAREDAEIRAAQEAVLRSAKADQEQTSHE